MRTRRASRVEEVRLRAQCDIEEPPTVKRPCFLLLSLLCTGCVSPTEGPVPTDGGQVPAEAAAGFDGAGEGDALSIVSPGPEAGTDTADAATDAPVDLVTADAPVD